MAREKRRAAGAPAALAALASAALLLAAGCSPGDAGNSDPGTAPVAPVTAAADGTAAGTRIVNVEVTPITLATFVQHLSAVGEVRALHDITVSAQESGAIAALPATKGARVARGEPLARIADDLLAAQAKEARAMSEVADELLQRRRRLWEQDRVGAEMALLETRSQAIAAAARLEVLEVRLARTLVAAPVAGVIDELYVDVGETVSVGASVARVVTTDHVKVAAGVPERYAPTVAVGAPVMVTFDVLPGREFVGTVDYVGVSVDPRSRTVEIEVLLDNPELVVRPHMAANVRVERERLEQAIVISQDLVQRTEDGFLVYVAGQRDGAAVALAREVQLGPSSGDQVVVESGLAAGDLLITAGNRQVDDGNRIRVTGG